MANMEQILKQQSAQELFGTNPNKELMQSVQPKAPTQAPTDQTPTQPVTVPQEPMDIIQRAEQQRQTEVQTERQGETFGASESEAADRLKDWTEQAEAANQILAGASLMKGILTDKRFESGALTGAQFVNDVQAIIDDIPFLQDSLGQFTDDIAGDLSLKEQFDQASDAYLKVAQLAQAAGNPSDADMKIYGNTASLQKSEEANARILAGQIVLARRKQNKARRAQELQRENPNMSLQEIVNQVNQEFEPIEADADAFRREVDTLGDEILAAREAAKRGGNPDADPQSLKDIDTQALEAEANDTFADNPDAPPVIRDKETGLMLRRDEEGMYKVVE